MICARSISAIRIASSLVLRAGEEIAEGIDDAASAARDDAIGLVIAKRPIIEGKIAAAIELIAGKDEATALDRDVAHGSDPGIAAVSGGGAIDLDAFRVHRRTHQRQVVLPTDHRADFPERGIEDRHGRAIAKPPDQALGTGGHDLAVLAEQAAIGRKNNTEQ